MSLTQDEIYALLPAIHRTRDVAAGEPLKALLGVIAEQVGVFERNLDDFYADQFIETCADWVVPYIGDIVGWQGLFEGIPGTGAGRAEVANTIGYRRRKGTVIALEQIAHDVTGRPARIVEFFRLLATNENLNHLRPGHSAFCDLRKGAALENFDGPFDTLNRTVDVRRIVPRTRRAATPDAAPIDTILHGPGRFNIPEVGAYLWRWNSYRVIGQPAFAVDARRFVFSPLGNDMALFNAVQSREAFASRTGRWDVPQPITGREFHHNHHQVMHGQAGVTSLYGAFADGGSVRIVLDGTAVPLAQICICALDDISATAWAAARKGRIAIDPRLGRIAIAADLPAPSKVVVDYCYGFGMDMGGGPYNRAGRLDIDPDAFVLATIGAGELNSSGQPKTLADAVADFNALPAGSKRIVVVANFGAYDSGTTAIKLPTDSKLWIVAGEVTGAPWAPTSSRPLLTGDIAVVGLPPPVSADTNAPPSPGQLVLNGLLLAGALKISAEPVGVTVTDCTLVPGLTLKRDGTAQSPGVPSVIMSASGGSLLLDSSIAGPLYVDAAVSVRILDSIVDAGAVTTPVFAGADGKAEGGELHVENGTLIGKLRTHLMCLASNTIFLAQSLAADGWSRSVLCTRIQSGCVRYSFVPDDAVVPGRFQCLARDGISQSAATPKFISLRYGDPSYAMLAGDCPAAVWQGADDESEIGAFHDLFLPLAARNLRVRFGEYLPFSLEAGIFLVPSHRGRDVAIAAKAPPADLLAARHGAPSTEASLTGEIS